MIKGREPEKQVVCWRRDSERTWKEKDIKRKERKAQKEGKIIKEIYCSKKKECLKKDSERRLKKRVEEKGKRSEIQKEK